MKAGVDFLLVEGSFNKICLKFDNIPGGHLGILWVGMCRPGLQSFTPFYKKFP